MAQTMAVKLRAVFIKMLIGSCRRTINDSTSDTWTRDTFDGLTDIVAYFAGRLAGWLGYAHCVIYDCLP